ncbi:siderophore-interacting protein [Streptomyces sp. NPDC050560]|uniref:siderophore-interacting protein n=1 Tax=Streptomyces sp. NPDC050560 TaxID=3365630 RepID=UPI0037905529
MSTAVVAAPFRFFAAGVVRAQRLGPSHTRVTLGGEGLDAFASGGCDQSVSLFLPAPGLREPVVPVDAGDGWWHAWRELPDDIRAVMRSYTVRAQRPAPGGGTEIDIDFVLHGVGRGGDAGPAARWAATAAPGDKVVILGPAVTNNTAVRFRPPAGSDLLVMWADETALPAAGAILESLPAGLHARVLLEVPRAGDRQPLRTAADAHLTWLVREEGAPCALSALRRLELPPTAAPYAWLAGESGNVRELRRHLVGERGFERSQVTFVGYWRRGLTEEQLRAARR